MLRDDHIVRELSTGELYAVIERERTAVVARNIVSDEVRVFQEGQVVRHSPGLMFVGPAIQAVVFGDYSRLRSLNPIILAGIGCAVTATAMGLTLGVRGWLLLWHYIAGGLFGVLCGAAGSALKASISRRR